MNSARQYVKNVAMLVGQSFIQRILGMITTIILARTLGAASFGAYSVVTATSNSAYGLVRLGVDAAIHVHTAEGFAEETARRRLQERLAAGFLLLLLAGSAGGLGCLLLGDRIAQAIYGKAELAIWVQVAGIAVVIQCLSQFFYAAIVGLHRFFEYAQIMAASAAFNAIAISLAAITIGLTGAVAALIAVQGVTMVWLGAAMGRALRREGLRLVFRNSFADAGALLGFGFPFYAAGIISVPVVYYLQGMVVRIAGLEDLGNLRVIMALVNIVTFVPQSAAAAMVSMFVSAHSSSQNTMALKVVQHLKFVFWYCYLVASAIIISLPWVVNILFGDKYSSAAGIGGIAVFIAVLSTCVGVLGNALLAAKRVEFVFCIFFVQSVIFMFLGRWLIPIYGITGYLVAELLSYAALLTCVCSSYVLWRIDNSIKIRFFNRALILMAILLMYVCYQYLYINRITIIEALLAGSTIFIVSGCSYKVFFDDSERRVLRQWMGCRAQATTVAQI